MKPSSFFGKDIKKQEAQKKAAPAPKPRQKLSRPVTKADKAAGVIKHAADMRLNKFLANGGLCSRRDADTLIAGGDVSVNGKVVTEMGYKVKPNDKVTYKGKIVLGEKKVYILLNKPKDCVTTVEDPGGLRTVMDYIKGACTERVFPVGRLDRNTTGVLLLTNDGDVAARLTHPKYERKKIYHVFLDKKFEDLHFEKMLQGIELEDGPIKADKLSFVDPKDFTQLGIEIHSGRNRIVRRMFEHLGYNVEKLDRVMFAGLTKKKIERGKWRFLTEKEINMLKMS